MARLDDVSQSQQSFASAARARAAHGVEAEQTQDAGDQFAINAAADENDCSRTAKIKCARQHALVPEAVNLRSGFPAAAHRRDAFFGDDFEAPRAAYD